MNPVRALSALHVCGSHILFQGYLQRDQRRKFLEGRGWDSRVPNPGISCQSTGHFMLVIGSYFNNAILLIDDRERRGLNKQLK